MADRKSHRQMTSAEQVRRSEGRYGRDGGAHVASDSTAHGTSRGSRRGQHIATRADGAQSYAQRIKKKRRKRVLTIVLAVVLVAFVGVGAAAAAFLVHLNNNIQSTDSELVERFSEPVAMQDPFYMLLLGVDKSEGRSEDWGADASNFRSDTIILARIDAPAQKVTLVSIPRDTLVDMGINGERKINDAYSLGGGDYMTDVVEDLVNQRTDVHIRISAYAEVDFEQFTSIVDAIGGVEVTLPVDVVDDRYAHINLEAGTHLLDGKTALALVRSRHAYDSYGGGDFYRAANQRMVIGAIVKKILSLDAASMLGAVDTLTQSVTTTLSITDLASLAMQFQNFDVDTSFYTGQAPTESQYVNSVWYEFLDLEGWSEMMDRVDGGLPPYSDESQDFTHGVAGSIGVSSGGDEETDEKEDEDVEEPVFSGSVLVLNGAGVSGLAGSKSETLIEAGFEADSGNADGSHGTSQIYYNGDAHAVALGVAETLGVSEDNIKENDQGLSTDYDIVVVLGTDQAQ